MIYSEQDRIRMLEQQLDNSRLMTENIGELATDLLDERDSARKWARTMKARAEKAENDWRAEHVRFMDYSTSAIEGWTKIEELKAQLAAANERAEFYISANKLLCDGLRSANAELAAMRARAEKAEKHCAWQRHLIWSSAEGSSDLWCKERARAEKAEEQLAAALADKDKAEADLALLRGSSFVDVSCDAKPGSYKSARGVIPWKEGDELSEVTIRRMRDGQPKTVICPKCQAEFCPANEGGQ
jgi:hypothetical protein